MTNPDFARYFCSGDRSANNIARHPAAWLLNTDDLAWLTGTSKSTWEKMRMRGEGPPFIKVRNLIWYRWTEVNAWLREHEIPTEECV
jgi:hypothetical protein